MNSQSPRARQGLASALVVALGVFAPLWLFGCARGIGDNCTLNTDCSAAGDRTCDMSQPGGYCTIEGCDQTSCPENSACVRFFPEQFLSRPCDPACEDIQVMTQVTSTCPDRLPTCPVGRGPTNDCAADEVCLPAGLCAPRASERRLCVKTCGSQGDCRGGYECRAGGTLGSLPVLSDPCGTVSFCAPQVQ